MECFALCSVHARTRARARVCVCVCVCGFLPPHSLNILLYSKQNKSTRRWRLVQEALAHLPFSLLPSWVAPAHMYLGLRCRIFSWSQIVWPWEMAQGILQGNKGMELSWLFKIHMSGGPAPWWSQVWDICPRDWGLWMFEGKFCLLERISCACFPCKFYPQAGKFYPNSTHGLTGLPHVQPHPCRCLAWGDQMHCLEFCHTWTILFFVSSLLSEQVGVKLLFNNRVSLDLGRNGWGGSIVGEQRGKYSLWSDESKS